MYTYADGGSYDGQWDRDKISGEGRARYADGNVYEGSWVNGKIHGTGKLETSKFSYDGEWRDGKKHGEGSCRYHDNGDDYEGSWAEDKWHGHGVWTLRGEDGSVHEKFVGDMLNGQMHGNGRYQYADGSHYDGQWPVTCVEIKTRRHPGNCICSMAWRFDAITHPLTPHRQHNKMHGSGPFTFANGNEYVGEFVEDAKEGRGSLQYIDGERYDGEWYGCLLYTSPSPRDQRGSRMPSSA